MVPNAYELTNCSSGSYFRLKNESNRQQVSYAMGHCGSTIRVAAKKKMAPVQSTEATILFVKFRSGQVVTERSLEDVLVAMWRRKMRVYARTDKRRSAASLP